MTGVAFSVGDAVEAFIDGARSGGDVVEVGSPDVLVRFPRLPRPVWVQRSLLRLVVARDTIVAPPPVEAAPRCSDGDELGAWLAQGSAMVERAESELVEAEAKAERLSVDVRDAEALLGQTRREHGAAVERVAEARARMENVRRVVKGGL